MSLVSPRFLVWVLDLGVGGLGYRTSSGWSVCQTWSVCRRLGTGTLIYDQNSVTQDLDKQYVVIGRLQLLWSPDFLRVVVDTLFPNRDLSSTTVSFINGLRGVGYVCQYFW